MQPGHSTCAARAQRLCSQNAALGSQSAALCNQNEAFGSQNPAQENLKSTILQWRTKRSYIDTLALTGTNCSDFAPAKANAAT